MQAARSLDTGGMATFTSYFFSPIGWKPRWDLVWRNPNVQKQGPFSPHWDDRINPDEWDLDEGEYVPWLPLFWQMQIAHDERSDGTIVAGFGTGKTLGMAAVAVYWCGMISGFKYMDAAPVGWQAKQQFDAARQELFDWDNRMDIERPIHHLVEKIVERPYPKIIFKNGSSMEFMSADEQGAKILSWNGDAACVDEADKLEMVSTTELGELIINLGSRLRGQLRGRERLGKLIVMANSGYDPELWERFDMAEVDPKNYYSIRRATTDNPYLTRKQIGAIERRIPDPRLRDQLLNAERPLPRGKEFTPELLAKCQDRELDNIMDRALERKALGYRFEEMRGAGAILWATPPSEHDQYIIAGDPGQNMPPNRNSAVVAVIKCTNFPKQPAELAAFWWGPQNPMEAGSYWPFIYQFEKWAREYRVVYSGYDATGVQKGFDELVFIQRGLIVEGLNMAGQKMRMVMALKLIMGKGLLRLPEKIASIWSQLASWRMPDTKLRQDVASCLFMAGDILNRLFLPFEDEEEEEEWEDEDKYGPRRPNRRPAASRRRRATHPRPNRQ